MKHAPRTHRIALAALASFLFPRAPALSDVPALINVRGRFMYATTVLTNLGLGVATYPLWTDSVPVEDYAVAESWKIK